MGTGVGAKDHALAENSQLLLRLGYCDDPGDASPRRPLEAVLVAAGDDWHQPC